MNLRNKLRNESNEDRAVSPIIGVVLMVAITVILAAVIGTFVLDLGQSAGETAPQASLSVSVDPGANTTTVEHTGGDALDAANTRVIIEVSGSSAEYGDGGANNLPWSGTFTVGSEHTFSTNHPTFTGGDQVTVTVIDTESQRQIFETTVTA